MGGGRRFAVLALMLAACGGGGAGDDASEPSRPAVASRRLQVDGVSRDYRLYTPPDAEQAGPVPLVLALHGSGNTVESLVDSSEFDEAADIGGFIVAYPAAIGISWNAGFCCTTGRGDPKADVRFLDQLITDVASVRRIDERRVYAVGVSAGGIMAYRLACDLSGRIAGAGAIAATMALDDCHPSRSVPVSAIHGTADDVVPYAGGRIQGGATGPAPAATAVAERWASLNACQGPRAEDVRGLVTVAGWSECAAGSRVRLVSVEGGGHNWYLPVYGPPNGAIDATATFTEFFGLGRR